MTSKRRVGSIGPGALAVGTVSALFCALVIFGHCGTPACAQTSVAPLFNPNAKIEVKQPDATTVPKTGWPLLPHETLTVPLPEKPGCFHLVDGSWQEVPCMTEKEMKRFPPPAVADTIVSGPPLVKKGAPTPLTWGAVATQLINPEQSGENDSKLGGDETYSIQANTNTFACSSCSNGFPFKTSQANDQGWVQFTYQQAWQNVHPTGLCAWNVDTTVANATNNNDGYASYCVSLGAGPLTGNGSQEGTSEVIGYVQCGQTPEANNVGPNGCTLWAFGYIDNTSNPEWYSVAAPDNLGLGTLQNWTSMGGSLYGEGGGSKAVFTNATLLTNVVANTCNTSATPGDSTPIFMPNQCSPNQTKKDLTASLASTGGDQTAETNNLTPGNASFGVTEYEGRLWWWGTTGMFTTQTTVRSSENPSSYGNTVTFTATVTGQYGDTPTEGTVQFLVDGSAPSGWSPVSISPDGTFHSPGISSLSAGNHSVTAKYSGYEPYDSSSGQLSGGQTVNQASSTTTVSSSAKSRTYGQSVTFTATVTGSGGTPTGTVTFLDETSTIGTGTLSGGVATISTSTLSAGKHTITANYNGDNNFKKSSGKLSGGLTVNQASSTTTVTSGKNPSNYGVLVTFYVTVSGQYGGTPTGTVRFLDGTSTVGTADLTDGTGNIFTSSPLTVGKHTITANYSGDNNFKKSSGKLSGSQTVNAAPTVTTVSSDNDPSVVGQKVTFTATVTGSCGSGYLGGTVQFVVNNKDFGKPVILSNNTASISDSSLPQGTYPVSANYLGDTDCQKSSGTLTGGQSVLFLGTISLASSSNPSVYGQSVTLTATVTGPSGAPTPTGTVTFLEGAPGHQETLGSPTLANGSASISESNLAVGSDSITVYYSGDKNYILCSAVFTQTVTPGTQMSVVSSLTPSVYGQSVTFMATVYGGVGGGQGTPTGTVQFTADQGTAQQVDLGKPSLSPSQGANLAYATVTTSSLSVGNHTITANYSGDSTFHPNSATCSQTVKQASSTTTVSSNPNPSTYGELVTFTATVTGQYGGTPTGTVQFVADQGTAQQTVIGTGTLSGGSASVQYSSLSVGMHTITANYSGDTNFQSSTGTLPGEQTVYRT